MDRRVDGSTIAKYQNSKREKIDLDGDGTYGGKLWIQSKGISVLKSGPRAWEVFR